MPMWLFPAVLTVLNLAAAGICTVDGDWRRGVYWALCAAITVAVTL